MALHSPCPSPSPSPPPPPSWPQRLYRPLGFAKGYNLALFIIFAGALMGFSLSRLPYLDYRGTFCGASLAHPALHTLPGECYYFLRGSTGVGMLLHLATVLPAGVLVCFQFVPRIRHRWLLVHRVNGYVILLLSLVSTAGAFMNLRTSFGGGPEAQMYIGVVGALFLLALGISYVNIKRLQIEQHRAWMLRAWFYACSIITLRIILSLGIPVLSRQGDFYTARPCAQIDTMFPSKEAMLLSYPGCAAFYETGDGGLYVMVHANRYGNAAEVSAAAGMLFGASGWLALTLHAIGIEVYLRLTPVEHERLRNVSYQRQVEAGMRNPGRAGLTADRVGDSTNWVPSSAK
ncbi:hypothetical protein B0H67DRAFT_508854 [Lasiosphaeris hirsuta]|uniref:Microtubule associated protein n=1 Tax=Lasiosphaeris hirsuta TaxID=260670 RepID=A0AA40B189_9PEZI|nr:hypothetical protein B0H67DRAFT_508854 [Lasiosphaeris hirsuta]